MSKVNKPGLCEDGSGLRLVVTDKGTKKWALRLSAKGRGALSCPTGGRRKSETRVCKDNSGGPKGDPFLTKRQDVDGLCIWERNVWQLIEDCELPTHRFGSSTRAAIAPQDDEDDDGEEPPRSG